MILSNHHNPARTRRSALVFCLVCWLPICAVARTPATVATARPQTQTRNPPQTGTTPPQSQVNIAPANPSSTTAAVVTQQDQGRRYGQPGFIGEPLNLSVVNADIRDILTFITSQYDVNFIIDKSVGAVPVTVTINDVPWNTALDSILRANRLGIEATGNILRVATLEVITSEGALQQQARNTQLDNSPLITEFIRLNYARASGTLAQVAGASGGFSGGVTSGLGAGLGGAAVSATRAVSGSGADEGILPIIQRRLSRRGGIEVDGRSNTLIVTDVPENIAAVRQLVAILDQPEPQVEIEVRIVIADRNFSRDLGVQLGANVFNSRTGAFGTASTLPQGANTVTSGTSTLFTAPQPNNSLSVGGFANTVIGLTTGILGTAQLNALITAGETKGQAKIVATPRVTALNNRPSQIESGQQIPVVTPQTSSGGGTVFTTTFVSVPLRLSVTPQITDAGTVILRIVAENNSINLGIAVGGTPGIDSQRMQSEVLVPDGGTTVMGGVLSDQESEAQNRTPGLSGIPVVGNLFKRKATTRNTREVLFFITPRIYRPNYQGQPTSGAASTGTRSTTIVQPVPLGNPPTNSQQTSPQPSGLPTFPLGSTLPATGITPIPTVPPSEERR